MTNLKSCMLSTGLLQMKILNSFGLLVHSIDRLLVVCFPMYYFRSIRKLNTVLLTGLYVTSFAVTFSSIIITLSSPARMIGKNCPHYSTLHSKVKVVVQFLIASCASMSILVMLCVVYCIKRRYNGIVKNAANAKRDLQNFLKKQKRFTWTALISCSITLFLYVIPSLAQTLCIKRRNQTCISIALCSNLLCYLDSLNMSLMFLHRQEDVRKKMFNFLRYRLLNRIPDQVTSISFKY
uniref:G-protein coupled receptors family 1 profile domain-containing protein n=1 Tax=Onchocerca volvulus TaxID=6282 RepID=A0A8R1TMA1_ONCVO